MPAIIDEPANKIVPMQSVPKAPVVIAINDTGYWDDPKRVATWMNVIQNTNGQVMPDGIDPEQIIKQYNYYKQKFDYNSPELWEEDANDPMAQAARWSIAPSKQYTPPSDEDWYNNALKTTAILTNAGVTTVDQYYQMAQEQEQQIAQQQAQMGSWENLTPGEQLLMSIISPQPLKQSLEGRPVASNVAASVVQGALSALPGFGLLATPLAPAALPIAAVLFASSMITSLTGTKIPVLSDVLQASNLPAQWLENIFGFVDLAAHDPTLAFEDIGNSLQAGHNYYETRGGGLGNVLGNVVAQIEGRESLGKNEVWMFDRGLRDPQKLPDGYYMGVDGLEEAVKRLNAGEPVMDVYRDFQDKYGWGGTVNDFLGQCLFDPLQLMPFVSQKLTRAGAFDNVLGDKGFGEFVNRYYETNPNAGKWYIDALPLGVSNVVSKITGKSGSAMFLQMLESRSAFIKHSSNYSLLAAIPNDLNEFIRKDLLYRGNIDANTIRYDNNGGLFWKTKDGLEENRISTVRPPVSGDVTYIPQNADSVDELTLRKEYSLDNMKKVPLDDETMLHLSTNELYKLVGEGQADTIMSAQDPISASAVKELNNRGFTTHMDVQKSLNDWTNYQKGTLDPILVQNKPTRAQRLIYGLDKDWQPKELSKNNSADNFFKRQAELTPTAQYMLMRENVMSWLGNIFGSSELSIDSLYAIFKKIADPKLITDRDRLNSIFGSGTGNMIVKVIGETINESGLERAFQDFKANAPRQAEILKMAKAMNGNVGDVLEAIKSNPENLVTKVNEVGGLGGADPLTVDLVKSRYGDMTMKDIDPRWFTSEITEKIMTGVDKTLVDKYGVKMDGSLIRLSKLMKSAFQMAILGTSPTLPLYNLVNDIATRAAVGVGGFKSATEIDNFMVTLTNGLLPEYKSWNGLERDYNLGGVTYKIPADAFDSATASKDWMSQATRLIRRKNDKIPSMIKLTGWIESAESKRAYGIGAMRTWNEVWRPDVMPDYLKQNSGMTDEQADVLWRIARNSNNADILSKKINGELETVDLVGAIDRIAKKVSPDDPEMAKQLVYGEVQSKIQRGLDAGQEPADIIDYVKKDLIDHYYETSLKEQIKWFNDSQNAMTTEGFGHMVKTIEDIDGMANEMAMQDAVDGNLLRKRVEADPSKKSIIYDEYNQNRTRRYEVYNAYVNQTLAGMLSKFDVPETTKAKLTNAFVADQMAKNEFYKIKFALDDVYFKSDIPATTELWQTRNDSLKVEYQRMIDSATAARKQMFEGMGELYEKYGGDPKGFEDAYNIVEKAAQKSAKKTQELWDKVEKSKSKKESQKLLVDFFGKEHVADLMGVNNELITALEDLRVKIIGGERDVVNNPLLYTLQDVTDVISSRLNQEKISQDSLDGLTKAQNMTREVLLDSIAERHDLKDKGAIAQAIIDASGGDPDAVAKAIQPIDDKADIAYVVKPKASSDIVENVKSIKAQQDAGFEDQPKQMQNRSYGLALEHAGDVVRETWTGMTTGSQDGSYILEKLYKIAKLLDEQETFDPPSSKDMKLQANLRDFWKKQKGYDKQSRLAYTLMDNLLGYDGYDARKTVQQLIDYVKSDEFKLFPTTDTAQIPVMITKRMESDLRGLGFTKKEIDGMTPVQAWENLNKSKIPKTPVFIDNIYPSDLFESALYPKDFNSNPSQNNFTDIMVKWAQSKGKTPEEVANFANFDTWKDNLGYSSDVYEAIQWYRKQHKQDYIDLVPVTIKDIKTAVKTPVVEQMAINFEEFKSIDPNDLLPVQPVEPFRDPLGRNITSQVIDGQNIKANIPEGWESQPVLTKKGYIQVVGTDPTDPAKYIYYHNGKYKVADAISDSPNTSKTNPNGFIPNGTAPKTPPNTGLPGLETYSVWTKNLLDGLKEEIESQRSTSKIEGLKFTKKQRDAANIYKQQVIDQMSNAKLYTLARAKQLRDDAMLNYNRRYGFDSTLELAMPYQFWFTRTMANWAARFWDKPAWYAAYIRYRNAQDKLEQAGLPSRLKRKTRVYAPFLPEWMGGGLWQDPLTQLFPYSQITGSIERITDGINSIPRQAEYVVYDMVQDERITQEEADKIVKEHAGKIWEEAVQIATANSQVGDPVSFAGMMMSFAPWITVPYYALIGQKDRINPLPVTRLGQSIQGMTVGTPLEGAGKVIGSIFSGAETTIRKAAGMNEFGQWGEYYIKRELGNMASDGVITPDQARIAMIEGESNQQYAQARGRVLQELSLRTPGGSFAFYLQSLSGGTGRVEDLPLALLSTLNPSGLLPEGEIQDRRTKLEYNNAWEQNTLGDDTALKKFSQDHPEYKARLAVNQEPEKLLQKFLVDKIWERWNLLTSEQKNNVKDSFGNEFNTKFLTKETRDYDAINANTLAGWAQFMGSMIPAQAQGQNIVPIEPPTSPSGTQTSVAEMGWEPEVEKAIQVYLADKASKFPANIGTLNSGYFEQPDKESKKAYLVQYPIVKQYWDWKDQYEIDHPELGVYFASNSANAEPEPDYSSAIVQNMDSDLLNAVMAHYYTGRRLTPQVMEGLQALWESTGSTPETRMGSTLSDFINYYLKPAFVK